METERKCETCRWWGEASTYEPKTHRICMKIPASSVDELDAYSEKNRVKGEHPDVTEIRLKSATFAYTCDGEDSDSCLKTRGDFGCVLHEKKE